MADSPVDQLLEQLRASLNLQRRDAVARVEQIRGALEHYLSAVEADIVRDFASTHGFGKDTGTRHSKAESSAATLLKLVNALPELNAPPVTAQASATAQAPAKAGAPDSRQASALRGSTGPGAVAKALVSTRAADDATLEPTPSEPSRGVQRPTLGALASKRPLVVVGRLGKRERLLALEGELPSQVEWLDTNQNGMAAIGNLERRLRERRVAALVLVEGSLGHKHTEPLVSAARQFSIPFAYANKGGKQSILRALDEIEAGLARSSAVAAPHSS